MNIQKIKELVNKGEITTPSLRSKETRKSEGSCRIELFSWSTVKIELQTLYVKDAGIAEKLKEMIREGSLTNLTKRAYDTGNYKKLVKEELELNYDKFMVGKRPFYVKRNN